jgi:hypothetical protein
VANQRVPTANLVEVANGEVFQPLHVPQALAPSTGSILFAPPNVTRIVGVDFQLTTFLLTAGAGVYTSVTWPAVGFAGIMSSQQRFYNSGIAPPLTSTIGRSTNTIALGQSTQLLLDCSVQSYSSTTAIMLGQCNIVTKASSVGSPLSQLLGPWFGTGLKYTGFSAVASTMIYTPTAVAALPVSLGISARLYAIYVQS